MCNTIQQNKSFSKQLEISLLNSRIIVLLHHYFKYEVWLLKSANQVDKKKIFRLNKLLYMKIIFFSKYPKCCGSVKEKFQCKCNIWLKSHEHEKSFSFRDILYQMHRQNAVHMSPIRCLFSPV